MLSIPYPAKVDEMPLKTSIYAKYVISQIFLANKQTGYAGLEKNRTYTSKNDSIAKWMEIRHGSRINTSRFPTSREVGGMVPQEMFWILTPQSLLSWVSESFRQDIYSLFKPFSRFQLGKFKVFY